MSDPGGANGAVSGAGGPNGGAGSAKAEILERIARALADRPAPPDVPRDYRAAGTVVADPDLFAERVEDYRATVHRAPADDVPGSLTRILTERGITRVAVPDGFPPQWEPAVALLREPLDVDALDEVSAVLTTCATAIAETGTIVLDAGPGQGPRALTLVPDYHLVVVRTDQVQACVPDAVAFLTDISADGTRPQTWISGPSATSDIELRRVEGVHGPRTLDVLLLDS